MKKTSEHKHSETKQSKADTIATPLGHEDGIIADPDGSWTGVPEDGGRPVQDADDL